MLLLCKPELITTPSRAGTSTPLMLLHVIAPQFRTLRPQRRRATTNTRATSRARGTAPLPKDKTETPTGTHAGAGDRRRAKVGLVGHLGRAEGGSGRECRRCTGGCYVSADRGCTKGWRLPQVLLCERGTAAELWTLGCLEFGLGHAQELSLAHDKAVEVVEVGHDGLLIEYGVGEMC